MTQFNDARRLVEHCEGKLPELLELHAACLTEQTVKPEFQIEVKNFMENLRSALDYCAAGLFAKYGKAKKAKPRTYFPYAKHGDDRKTFRERTVERCIPGLLASRPDMVDRLETYQYFGNSGNWLQALARITNENKHEQLTPQNQNEHTGVRISARIPAGETLELDLKNIPLGGSPDKPFHAVAITWRGLEFTSTGALVMPLLEHAVPNVRRVVEELSSL